MSGYFARLSAQLQSPAAPARRVAAPAALEQHVEVDSTATAQARGVFSDGRIEQAAEVTEAHALLPRSNSAAAPVLAPMTASIQTASPQHTSLAPTVHEASATAAPQQAPLATPTRHTARPPLHKDPFTVAPDTSQPAPFVRPSSDRTAMMSPTAPTTMAPASSPRAQAAPVPAQATELQARHDSARALSPAAREVRPTAFVQPVDRHQPGERAPGITPRAAMPSTPAATPMQSTVRIGTITLEVHPPAVTAPAAPQPVAAAPTPAPSQFSLRRHHVRWS